MTVRAIDANNDWTFGKGRNNYRSGIAEVNQNIKTRLQSFVGDCFFAKNDGLDWWGLLGTKQILKMKLQISSTILQTENVEQIFEVTFDVDAQRGLLVQYNVLTSYGVLSGESAIGVV